MASGAWKDEKHIVVLGCGVAGVNLCKDLVASKVKARVTLVTGCEFAEAPWCMPWVLCKPEEHYRALSTTPEIYAR